MSKSSWKNAVIAAAGVLVLTMILVAPDVVFWRTLDRGLPPLRAFLGDQHYYLLRVHDVLSADGPIASPYFLEHRSGQKRFVVFETAVASLGAVLKPFIGDNPAVWSGLLSALTISALFLELAYVFRRWAKRSFARSMTLSFLFTLWLSPWGLLYGNALVSWFTPIAFFGVIAAVEGLNADRAARRLGLLSFSALAFAVHPIAFALGVSSTGLALLLRLVQRPTRRAFLEAAAWGAVVIAIGFALFGAFLLPDRSAAAAAAETLKRNAFIESRLPTAPIASLRTLAIAAILIVCRRRTRPGDAGRTLWDLLIILNIAAFLGANVNIATGKYFLNEHFFFLQPLTVGAAAGLALALPSGTSTKKEKIVILAVAALFIEYALRILGQAPIWAMLNVLSPMAVLSGVAILTWTAWGKPPAFPSRHRPLMTAALAFAALFPAFLVWKTQVAAIDGHDRLQPLRPLLRALEEYPVGAVLSNPSLSDVIALYTPQHPYWSPLAFGDEASNEELRRRWRDALVFYANDAGLTDASAKRGLYGHENMFCSVTSTIEEKLYKPLSRFGFTASLCRETLDDKAWGALAGLESAAAIREASTGAWRPSYRLDYLVLDLSKNEKIPKVLSERFGLLVSDDRFAVYRYQPL